MTRIDITDWCDFIRGVADPEVDETLHRRLAEDAAARRTVEILQRVDAVSQVDRALNIPEHALRGAKALASLQRPNHAVDETRSTEPLSDEARSAEGPEGESWWSTLLERLPVRVAFDNLLQPSVAGTRDLQSPHRQILFEADEYTVDVRWEQEADAQHTVVIGQALKRDEATQPLTNLPIYVIAENKIVARAQTNRFGEFQADKLPKKPLRLCLLVGERTCLDLPLVGGAIRGEGKQV